MEKSDLVLFLITYTLFLLGFLTASVVVWALWRLCRGWRQLEEFLKTQRNGRA